jgi:hypothetical protein
MYRHRLACDQDLIRRVLQLRAPHCAISPAGDSIQSHNLASWFPLSSTGQTEARVYFALIASLSAACLFFGILVFSEVRQMPAKSFPQFS